MDKSIPEYNTSPNQQNPNVKISLYDLLGVPKDANIIDIKKAFKIMALKLHPDKNQDDAEATKNFQRLNEAYQILIDPEKRKIYDETGSTGDDETNENIFCKNFRFFSKRLEKSDIEDFERRYKGSEEEINDLMEYYKQQKGNIANILEEIILSTPEDIPRYISIFEEKIKNKELKNYKAFNETKDTFVFSTSSSYETADDEDDSDNNDSNSDEWEDEEVVVKEVQPNKNLTSQISSLMLERYKKHMNMIDELEKKYCGNELKKHKEYNLNDQEFEKFQKKIFNHKRG